MAPTSHLWSVLLMSFRSLKGCRRALRRWSITCLSIFVLLSTLCNFEIRKTYVVFSSYSSISFCDRLLLDSSERPPVPSWLPQLSDRLPTTTSDSPLKFPFVRLKPLDSLMIHTSTCKKERTLNYHEYSPSWLRSSLPRVPGLLLVRWTWAL